jgi:hypothetical protein
MPMTPEMNMSGRKMMVTVVNMNIALLLFSPRTSIELRVCYLKQYQHRYLHAAKGALKLTQVSACSAYSLSV